MTKDKDIKTAVPALRFPEFRDDDGWREKALSEILDYERPDNYIVSSTNYCQQGIPVLTANKSFILGYTEENYGICNNLPVVIFDDFTVDKKYVEFPFKVKSSAIKLLRPKTGNNLRFAFEMMSLVRFEAKEHKRYYISSYQTQKVYIPNPTEQAKIANCLVSLDDLISAVADKIEALKEYKKGLMQQLFPAEGKTTPALRFPEFQNAGEWKETILGKVGNPLMCKRILKEQTTSDAVGNIPFYKIGTFGGNSDAYIPKGIFEDYKQKYSYPNKGDILISAAGTIGRLVVYDGEPAYFQDSNIVWIGNPETEILNAFLYRVYQTLKWKTSDGGIVSRLYNDNLKSMTIVFPKNKKEQQKIADCLSSMDNFISAETDKLDQLKAHKKGLMQQLFPTLNE